MPTSGEKIADVLRSISDDVTDSSDWIVTSMRTISDVASAEAAAKAVRLLGAVNNRLAIMINAFDPLGSPDFESTTH